MMKKRLGARLGLCALGVMLVGGSTLMQAGAEEYDLGDGAGEGPNLQVSGQSWSVTTESRMFEGQENIPFENRYGQPTTQIELINPPVQCEAYAAQYFVGDIVEQGVLATTGLYYNRTMARARNPRDGGKGVGGAPSRTPKVETGPGTQAAGPYTLAECPNRATGHAFAREMGVDGVFGSGITESDTKVDPVTKTMTSETYSAVENVTIEGGLNIKKFYSYLKTVHPMGKDPVFTYELTAEGVTAGGQEIAGFGDKGIRFASQSVAGPDAIKQFNEQANSQSKSLEKAFVYGLRFGAPKFYFDNTFDKFNFESPVAEGSIAFPARKGTAGDFQAGRLGVNNYRGLYNVVDTSGPSYNEVTVEK